MEDLVVNKLFNSLRPTLIKNERFSREFSGLMIVNAKSY